LQEFTFHNNTVQQVIIIVLNNQIHSPSCCDNKEDLRACKIVTLGEKTLICGKARFQDELQESHNKFSREAYNLFWSLHCMLL
jgi:hypothetical protein